MWFSNRQLLTEYLKITKDILIPCLKSQTNKNFIWGIVINKDDINFVKDYLQFDFLPFNNYADFTKYVISNNIQIQTRHDIDDYMSDSYVDRIQKEFLKNILIYDMFLVQFQPKQVDYYTKKEYSMNICSDTAITMFLSLCQKNVKYDIFEKEHGYMNKLCNNVITISEEYVKWIIHGNNISCKNNQI